MNYLKLFNNFKKIKELKTEYLKRKIEIYKDIKKNYPTCFKDLTELSVNTSEELIFLLSTLPKLKTSRYEIYKDGKYGDNDMTWRYPYEDFYYPNCSYGRLNGRNGLSGIAVDGNKLVLPQRYSNETSDIKVDLLSLSNIDIDKAKMFIEFVRKFAELNRVRYSYGELSINFDGEVFIKDRAITNLITIVDKKEYGLDSKKYLETFKHLLEENDSSYIYLIKNFDMVIKGLEDAEEKKKKNKKDFETLFKEVKDINDPLRLLKDI